MSTLIYNIGSEILVLNNFRMVKTLGILRDQLNKSILHYEMVMSLWGLKVEHYSLNMLCSLQDICFQMNLAPGPYWYSLPVHSGVNGSPSPYYLSTVMFCLSTCGQPTMNWAFRTHESKQIFILFLLKHLLTWPEKITNIALHAIF